MRGLKNFLDSFRPLPVTEVVRPERHHRGGLLDEVSAPRAALRLNAEGNVPIASGRVMTEEGMRCLIERVKRHDFR